MAKEEKNKRHNDDPVVWFAILEIARRKNDFERAAEAKRELARLGVNVNYDSQKEVCHAG